MAIVEPRDFRTLDYPKSSSYSSHHIAFIIDGVVDNIGDESPEEIKSIVKKYKEKLKKFRSCGLEKGGEMSIENLVFKLLRRNGYIGKLYDIPTKLIDKKLSMNQ